MCFCVSLLLFCFESYPFSQTRVSYCMTGCIQILHRVLYEVARHSAPKGNRRRTSNKEDGGSSLDDSCGDSKPKSAGSVDVVFSSWHCSSTETGDAGEDSWVGLLSVFAKWTSGMLSAAYYSCLSFYWPDAELVIIVLECEGRQCRSACNVAIMPYYTRRSLDEWSFLRSRRHRRRPSPTKYPVLTRCSYKVLRSHPDTLPSAPFLAAAQFKYLLIPLPLHPGLVHPFPFG